ncbi:hypothetical protein EOD42_13875 [Rhodovarius crocodyli]|uniref:Uncharacterized protein n=1 Tax=Rhodovarius crocodyli TaxID=1979269 RepID=A0A437MEW3_9PROT|nr:hypothetical protein [Rhodovarius crocodyli]RVT96201.1 hypothetical protein EOD42_13875 [Rhodovarius crocodyli]
MSKSDSAMAAPDTAADSCHITIDLLSEWDWHEEGREWFRTKFPDGASYGETSEALLAENLRSDALWLDYRAIDAWGLRRDFVARAVTDMTRITQQAAGKALDSYAGRSECSIYSGRVASSAHAARLAVSTRFSNVATSGDASIVVSSGYADQIAACGDESVIAASGSCNRLAVSGDESSIAATGGDGCLASSGRSCRLAASGRSSRLAAAGPDSSLMLGPDSCGSAVWWDGVRYRFATCTTSEGELSPGEQRVRVGVRYRVSDTGQFEEDA